MTANRYKYWGNWGLPIRGVFGKTTIATISTIVAAKGILESLRWRAEVRRLGG
ncbi:MAG: hypothetical protein KatS3mg023_3883 [Armatimonadota bacterium]|nr:MAG: hypothetical protein KatS3mg023_3883 [Armatimonadota bacterium]